MGEADRQNQIEDSLPADDKHSSANQVVYGDLVHGDKVGGDKITTGDINASAVAIGRGAYASFVQIIKQPALWQDIVFNFLSIHRYYFVVLGGLIIALLLPYWFYKDLYLIEWWWFAGSVLLIIIVSWTFYTSYPIRRINLRTGVSLLGFIGLAAILGWHSMQIISPLAFDEQVFGIALAEIGEGGFISRTSRTRELTNQVYERLCLDLGKQYAREQEVVPCLEVVDRPDQRRVAVQRIGIIPDSQMAATFGSKINADVVVWGRILPSDQGGITMRFEVLETLDKAINPDFRVIMPVTTRATEILGSEQDISDDPVEAKEVATQQAIAISSYVLGLIAYLDRDFPEAVRQLEITLDTLEESPILRVSEEGKGLIYFYLGRAYQALSRVGQGQEILLQAKDANPEEPAFLISLALGYGSIGPPEGLEENLDLALEKLNTFLLSNPEDSNALFDRGLVYEIKREYANAAFDYERLLKNDPTFYTAYIQLGLVTFELGRIDDAADWFNKGIALAEASGTNPASAYLRLGEIYEKAGRVELARENYQKAVQFDPGVDRVQHYYARFLERQQEMDAALLAYQKMVEVSYLKGWAYNELASFYRRRGLLEHALVNYQRAIGAENDNPLLYTYLAETYKELGDQDKALQAYDRAVEVNEKAGTYYVYGSYAGFLFQIGQYADAADMYQKSLELRPVDYAALMNLGQASEASGDISTAVTSYCQVISNEEAFSADQIQTAKDRLANLGFEGQCP